MFILQTMTNKIAAVFYDKTVNVLKDNVITDSEGGVNYRGLSVIDNFKGNVNFSNCKKIQEDYGLDYQIDVNITTNYDLLKQNDLISYENITYNITDVIHNDSHVLILASKWQNQ